MIWGWTAPSLRRSRARGAAWRAWVHVYVSAAVSCALLVPGVSFAEEPSANPGLVAVFDVQADGVSGSDVSQLPDLLEQVLQAHPGFDAVPTADLHNAVSRAEVEHVGCALIDACRREVARQLHANYVIFGSLAKQGGKFVLYISLAEANGTKVPTRTSESMKSLKSLPLNVRICLQRLFEWKDPGPMPVVRPVASHEELPPIEAPIEPESVVIAKPKVVAVLPLQLGAGQLELSEATRSAITGLPETLGKEITGHGGYHVLDQKGVTHALRVRSAKQPSCATQPACLAQVAGDLHADLLFVEALDRSGDGYALEATLLDAGDATKTRHVTKRMAVLDNLPILASRSMTEAFQFPPPAPAVPPKPAPVQAPAPATAARKRLLVIPFEAIGVDSMLVAPLPHLVDAELGKYREYDVVTTDDLKHLATAQDEKRKGGCAQDQACLTEIGAKLQADFVLTGSVGQVGAAYVISLTLNDAKGLTMARRATETARTKEELPGHIPAGVAKLLGPPVTMPAFHLPKGKAIKFAVLDIRPTGLTPQVAQNLTQVLSTEVKGIEGASVISREDISAILQLDEAKQKVGCDDDGCMVAIGGALGVDRLITGDAGKVGALYLVNLRLIDIRQGAVENRVTETFNGDEEQLLHAVRKAGRDLLGVSSTVTGKLAVTSNQAAANVFVDDKESGKVPALFADLTPRRHEVRIEHAGFFDWHGDVYVDPLETTSIWAELHARPQAWYQKWWVWTIAGGVVAGATVAAVVETRPRATTFGGTVTYP